MLIVKGYFKTPRKIVDLMVGKLFEKRHPTVRDSVLDTGCGPGDFIDGIIRWCNKKNLQLPNIVGVELDTNHVSKAEKKFQKFPEITIQYRDYLIFNDEKYDYIIGNPPYVPITQLSEEEKKLYKPIYQTAKGRFDLYLLFFEKSVKSLKKNGRLVYITPEKYTYVKTAKPLRKILTEKRIKEIEFIEESAFKGLTTYPTITVVENSSPADKVHITYRDGKTRHISLPSNGESWLPTLNGKKNSKSGHTFKDICERISCGVATGADRIFVKKNTLLKPGLERFAYPTISGRELIYDEDLPSPTFSMLIPYNKTGKLMPFNELDGFGEYLSQPHIKKRLEARTCVKRKPWYAFHETPPMRYLLRPKILCKDVSMRPSFWLDKDGVFVPRHSVYYVVIKDDSKLEEVLAYLQTDFAYDWLMKNCQRAANDFIRLQSNVMKKLPIPEELYNSINNG